MASKDEFSLVFSLQQQLCISMQYSVLLKKGKNILLISPTIFEWYFQCLFNVQDAHKIKILYRSQSISSQFGSTIGSNTLSCNISIYIYIKTDLKWISFINDCFKTISGRFLPHVCALPFMCTRILSPLVTLLFLNILT